MRRDNGPKFVLVLAIGSLVRKMKPDAARNIEAMTLRATRSGYVAVQQNTSGSYRWGSYQPALQLGDAVRAGMAVAQILTWTIGKSWRGSESSTGATWQRASRRKSEWPRCRDGNSRGA